MIFPYLKMFIKSIYYLGQPKSIKYDYSIFVYDYSSKCCLALLENNNDNGILNREPKSDINSYPIIRADYNDIKGFLKKLNI